MSKHSKKFKHLQKGCKNRSKACYKSSQDHSKYYVIFINLDKNTKKKGEFLKSILEVMKISGAVIWKLLKSKMI